MAKVVILDDHPNYAEMVANYLTEHGHHVMPDVIPFDVPAIERFGADVLVVSLVRKIEVLGQPITDFYKEVDGSRALLQLQEHASMKGLPLVLTAIAVAERELPPELEYQAYVDFPREIGILLRMVERLAKRPDAPAD
jgi:hypothetical protein